MSNQVGLTPGMRVLCRDAEWLVTRVDPSDYTLTHHAVAWRTLEVKGETWDSGVCHGAAFSDPDGNGLLIHHRYAPYLDGTTP